MENMDIYDYSFYRLLYNDGKGILIPQIQRDYAQGRSDKDVEDIRNGILEKLERVIFNEKEIHLDFIYGVQHDGSWFIPLDGQQRLTTLFLVHWYIFKRSSKKDLEPLLKFKYESRQASVDFCKALIKRDIDFSEKELVASIKDETWFYSTWDNDATVNGMLNMIQAIHNRFSIYWINDSDVKVKIEDFKKRNPITFNWLEIKSHGMTDDLYIKMNSRGKPLTRFENFKVRMEKHLHLNENAEKWKNLIDNSWTDLIWKYRNAFSAAKSKVSNADFTIDDEFMQFFMGMLVFRLAIEDNDTTTVQKFVNNFELPLSVFEEKTENGYVYFNSKDLADISLVLNWFSKFDDTLEIEVLKDIDLWLNNRSLLESFVSDSTSYSQRVKFYCIIHFIKQLGIEDSYNIDSFMKDPFNNEDLRKWMWRMRNLIENTVIDSPQTFVRAIKAIDKLGRNCLKFEDYLLGDHNVDFFGTQANEERMKLKIDWKDRMVNNNDQLAGILNVRQDINLLLAVENNPLYRGCISFLLPENEAESVDDFISNVRCAHILLDENKPFRKDNILVRTLLALTAVDYCENTVLHGNNENLRSLMKNVAFKEAFAKLFVALRNIDPENYLEYMLGIIDSYNSKSIPWKFYIVRNSELLNLSDSKKIALYSGKYTLYNTVNATDSVFVFNEIRNKLAFKLLSEFSVQSDNKVYGTGDLMCYRGLYIWFRYPIKNYYITIQFSINNVLLGFDSNQKEIVSIKNHDFGRTDYWLLYKNMGSYPDESGIDSWIKQLMDEINDINSYAMPIGTVEYALGYDKDNQ